jgi:gluconolactonase
VEREKPNTSDGSAVLAQALCGPEGPTVAPDGWVLNVCSTSRPAQDWPTRGGDIVATHRERPLDTHVLFNTSTSKVTGIPAALAFGPGGCLYVTDEGRRSIVKVEPDGTQIDVISAWSGERLNGPNDLSFDEEGNLFFTDPWTSSPENPIGGVYGYTWSTGELHQIDTGMEFPNGIVVREGRLYVAETYCLKVWVYEVVGPGRATGKAEFCTLPRFESEKIQGPDGMAFDSEGNLYVAHYGSGAVFVYDAGGILLDRIPTPGVNPTNLCFGGAAHDQLYVTVDDLGILVVLDLAVSGDRINFCPSTTPSHPWAALLPRMTSPAPDPETAAE